MIEFIKGNLLEAPVETLVNTVNTVGIMGKGIALQFRETFPENYKFYQKACQQGKVQLGKMLVYDHGQFITPRYIINFPTKSHWRENSRLEDVEAGLIDLQRVIRDYGMHSIAIPPLGCGSGGLDWKVVRPLIVQALSQFQEVRILIYEPVGAPGAERIQVGTDKPNMTTGRAALIYLMEHYSMPGYRFSLLEIQKLMYFLQIAGEPLKLNYTKKQYGPYAENLNHVLQRLEGHFLRGYGDRSRKANLYLLPGAETESKEFLLEKPETQAHLQKVLDLIEGFETPYGMELLSTVHWLAMEDPAVRENSQAAVKGFQAWNQHKRDYFKPQHIDTAWEHLRSKGWL